MDLKHVPRCSRIFAFLDFAQEELERCLRTSAHGLQILSRGLCKRRSHSGESVKFMSTGGLRIEEQGLEAGPPSASCEGISCTTLPEIADFTSPSWSTQYTGKRVRERERERKGERSKRERERETERARENKRE